MMVKKNQNYLKNLRQFQNGLRREDKRTVYDAHVYHLVPKEDEPSVSIMHDWIYLPTA
jgi:hypothetical protein